MRPPQYSSLGLNRALTMFVRTSINIIGLEKVEAILLRTQAIHPEIAAYRVQFSSFAGRS
jgi:hypothetical protein